MSEGPRASWGFASQLAGRMRAILQPYCERIEIAGSLRRGKETVGDIELVAIPKVEYDLLGEPVYQGNTISEVLRAEGLVFTMDGPLHKQFHLLMVTSLKSVQFDMYLTTPAQWGVMFMIRTGSADFSRLMVTPRNKGGMMPSQYQVKDGRVWLFGDHSVMATPEEEDVFKLWGIRYYEPGERE